MKIVIISGYFDPINGKGHIDYINLSKKFAGIDGKLIVIVNNDEQAVLKKGKYFMKCDDRMLIINELKNVDEVIKSIDTDRSVCNTLKFIHSIYKENELWFVNGGDSFNNNIPETQICNELNIKLLDGLGDKISSSSWLTGIKAIN
jgi:D-beta-D-heptose 7-phosphate kinase/D-beta-D-heptose 1-phosphate adenosyltransferase